MRHPNNFDDGIFYFEEFLKLKPKSSKAHERLIDAYRRKGDTKKTKEYERAYEKLLQSKK